MRRGGHVTAEAETGAVRLPTPAVGSHQKLGRGRSLQEQGPANTTILSSGLQRISPVGLSHPVWG